MKVTLETSNIIELLETALKQQPQQTQESPHKYEISLNNDRPHRGRCLFSFYKLFSYLRFYSSASKPPLFSLLSSSRSSVEPPLFSVFRPARGFPIFCPFAVVISVSILRSSHLSSVSVRTSVVLRFPSPRGIPFFCPFAVVISVSILRSSHLIQMKLLFRFSGRPVDLKRHLQPLGSEFRDRFEKTVELYRLYKVGSDLEQIFKRPWALLLLNENEPKNDF
ncbi:hypothetical protein LXL04_009022 [Taraxacum kok-saghyz]